MTVRSVHPESLAAAATAASAAGNGNVDHPLSGLDLSSETNLLDVINVLTSFRQNHERLKLYRVSLSVIRFLSILNFVYTLLGVTFLMLALCSEWTPEFNDAQRSQFFRIGLTVSVFAPLASFVDLLALRGLQLWRRGYMLPWLFLYAFAVSLVFANALAGIFHHGFRWTYLILTLCAFCLYSAWRHVRAQYNEMSRERPTCRTIEELAADLRQTAANVQREQEERRVALAANDLPPKYEDLDQPPVYDDCQWEAAVAAGAAGGVPESGSWEASVAAALPPPIPRQGEDTVMLESETRAGQTEHRSGSN